MKILFISLLVHLICNNAIGQISKDIWLIGGSGKLYSYNSKYNSGTYSHESRYTQIDLSTDVGYFIIDKLAIGIKPTFTSVKGKVTTPGGGSTNIQRYWIGPFARYYFLNDDRPFNILADISYQFGFHGGGVEGKLNTRSILVGPEIFFNSSVGLEVLFGYSYTFEDTEYFKEIRKGFLMGVGFKFHLEK